MINDNKINNNICKSCLLVLNKKSAESANFAPLLKKKFITKIKNYMLFFLLAWNRFKNRARLALSALLNKYK